MKFGGELGRSGVLASILPTVDTPVQTANSGAARGGAPPQPLGGGRGAVPRRKNSEMRPPADIVRLNTWMREYAKSRDIPFVDFYSALIDADGMLRDGWSTDGVHPTPAGCAVMAPLVESALQTALQ